MQGIKEAIEFIANLAVKADEPKTLCIKGKTYATKGLQRCDKPDMAEPIHATTLTALVDYIKERREELRERMILHVVSPTKVVLYSGLMEERDRETLFIAEALLPKFEYGREYMQEEFIVSLQTCFDMSDDREAVAMMASNIVSTQKGEYSDDGISQQAVIKSGVTSKDVAIVPNPVFLVPYRTFSEVEQPESAFVFRIREATDSSPRFKLVEADGWCWQPEAMQNVKEYLTEQLSDIPDRDKLTIIA